jgi:hypothetical protein
VTPPAPTVELPSTAIAEWFAIPTNTSTGLFVYRYTQAIDLLDLPDFGDGDLDQAQRKEALREAVAFKQPLTALALFLGVVALEDFVRDLIARMVDVPVLQVAFPNLAAIRSKPIGRSPEERFKRLDTDPAGFVDPEKVNELFQEALGVFPISPSEYWHIRDLALIRHTVAHHAATIRPIDVPRFCHFIVKAKTVINPPPDFVKSELHYLYKVGRQIEVSARNAVFAKILASEGPGWSISPSRTVIELIEFFAFFGYIESTNVPVGYSEPDSDLRRRQEVEAARVHRSLIEKCVDDLKALYGE